MTAGNKDATLPHIRETGAVGVEAGTRDSSRETHIMPGSKGPGRPAACAATVSVWMGLASPVSLTKSCTSSAE